MARRSLSLQAAVAVSGLSAAGTTQGTATALVGGISHIATVAAGAGVVLPTSAPGVTVTIINKGADALLVYPPVSSSIDALAANNAYSMPIGTTQEFACATTTTWYTKTTSESIGALTGRFKFNTGTTSVDPGTGSVAFNNAAYASVTSIYISQTTDTGTDADNYLKTLAAGDQIYVQEQDNSTKWLRGRVSSTPTDNGTWWTVPITLVNNGAGAMIASNKKCIVTVVLGVASGGGTTTNALTMNNGGSGAASGATFNGSAAVTISYNSIGAAPLASPAFTGTPSLPTGTTGITQTTGNSSTALATTAFVNAEIANDALVLTGNQTAAGNKTFSGTTALAAGSTIDSAVIGYRDIPITISNAAKTFALVDAGKGFGKDNTTAYTYTIPANASIAFPVGTAITVFNGNATSNITIAITTDTLRLAGTTTTGSRTLAPWGSCTLYKISSTVWLASGAGLT